MIRAQGLDSATNFLRAAPTLAQVAVNSAMVSGEYVGELKQLASRAIHAVVPTEQEYLIPVLLKLVDHDSTRGMMQFWIQSAAESARVRDLSDEEQLEFLKGIGREEVEFWVRHFKEIKEQDLGPDGGPDGEIDYDAITSRVLFAKTHKPEDWINPNRDKESLLAVSGAMGTFSDTDIVATALENVLASWTDYIARVVPDRIVENLATQLA